MQGEEKMKMKYDEYDVMLEIFKKLTAKTYYPDPLEIEKMSEEPDKWIKFACYLYEKGEKPKNQMERYSRENLKTFIQEHLELVDSECVTVELSTPEHGTVSFVEHDSNKFSIGDMCILNIQPDAGYCLDKIVVLDGLFQKKHLFDVDGELSFQVPDMDVFVRVMFKEVL